MAKTTIKGRFATGADAATVHQISEARRQWLDREIDKAVAEAVVLFVPLAAKNRSNGTKAAPSRKRGAVSGRAKKK